MTVEWLPPDAAALREAAVLRHPGLVLHDGRPPSAGVLGHLLADPRTGLLTGVVDWDLVLGPRAGTAAAAGLT